VKAKGLISDDFLIHQATGEWLVNMPSFFAQKGEL
jgi:hypothetical protein